MAKVILLNGSPHANGCTARALEEDALCAAAHAGFEHVDTLTLVLSSIAGKGIKGEPIFVLAKGEYNIEHEADPTDDGRLFDPDRV